MGSYSLEIHHYFDHHAHRTEVETYKLDPVKVPVNPYYTIVGFSINAGSKEFTVSQEVSIPLSIKYMLSDNQRNK